MITGGLARLWQGVTGKFRAGGRPRRPVVSVVLGTYNRREFLRAAVESVRENGLAEPYEIIVVDGGSSDGTIEWLVSQKDVVTIVQHNRGEFRGKPIPRRSWGYFMNLGFKSTQGRFVAMISDDCLLVPGALERGIARFANLAAEGRRVGAVAFYFRNWPQEKEYYVQRTLGRKLFVNHGMYLRSAMEEVGFADEERYRFYKADGDLCLKLWQSGFEVVDCPGAFVEHYLDANVEARASNVATLREDRNAYVARWAGVFDVGTPDVQDRQYVSFEDPRGTAARFPCSAAAGSTARAGHS